LASPALMEKSSRGGGGGGGCLCGSVSRFACGRLCWSIGVFAYLFGLLVSDRRVCLFAFRCGCHDCCCTTCVQVGVGRQGCLRQCGRLSKGRSVLLLDGRSNNASLCLVPVSLVCGSRLRSGVGLCCVFGLSRALWCISDIVCRSSVTLRSQGRCVEVGSSHFP
jgi:hypothetical protein